MGSYDAQLRLFDTRKLARPVSTLDVGGGIWRLKWHPSDPHRMLAACMHDGFKVVNVEAEAMKTACRFHEHGSLAYGADWALAVDGSTHVATCSFYDHTLIYSSLSS